jgi:hypothetical protein
MTEAEIIEIFIQAAHVDRKLPVSVGPARLKAVNIGIVHDLADINGYDEVGKDEWRWAWLDPKNLRNSKGDIRVWELSMELIKLIPSAMNRRALWNWSVSKAGGKPFAKWCREVESIQPRTGDWRRREGTRCISRAFGCNVLQHNEIDENSPSTTDTENGHNSGTIENDASKSWMAPDAKPMACDFDRDLQDFSWAAAQNERRRQREANARKKQAA